MTRAEAYALYGGPDRAQIPADETDRQRRVREAREAGELHAKRVRDDRLCDLMRQGFMRRAFRNGR